MTTKTDEQEREAFECFMSDDGKFPQSIERDANGNYVLMQAASSWHVWQARAALQSQDREDAVERLIEAVRNYMSFGCPVCSGDCFSANPPVSGCPVREAQEAIDHARRIEGEGK